MKKLKTMLSKASETLKNLFKVFPITFISIILITLFATVIVDVDFSILEVVEKILIFGVIFSVESFFIEVYPKSKKIKIIGYILSASIAAVFTHAIFSLEEVIFIRIVIGYLITLALISMYIIVKKAQWKFNEYILKVFANIFNSSLIYIILNIGITLLSVVFIELILNGSYGYFIMRTQILLLGLFYIPAILNSISNVKCNEVSSFIKGLIKYVLLTLITVGILIIYIYIVKIIIIREMPSNIIFRILAGMFVVAFPVWSMADNFKDENKTIGKITKVLPYLYIPFLLLEIYSVGIRILEYGITPIRYFGIMFIILQAIALILTVIKGKKHLNLLFICSAALVVIALITPLNFERVSLLSQKSILIKYVKEGTDFDSLQEKEKIKAASAYEYIKGNNGDKYIPEYIKSDEVTTKLLGYYMSGIRVPKQNNRNIYFYDKSKTINIEGYSKITEVYQYSTNNFAQIKFTNKDDSYSVSIDLEEFIKKIINKNTSKFNIDEYMKNNKYVKIDENRSLCIQNLDIMYNADTYDINNVTISGYILEK